VFCLLKDWYNNECVLVFDCMVKSIWDFSISGFLLEESMIILRNNDWDVWFFYFLIRYTDDYKSYLLCV